MKRQRANEETRILLELLESARALRTSGATVHRIKLTLRRANVPVPCPRMTYEFQR